MIACEACKTAIPVVSVPASFSWDLVICGGIAFFLVFCLALKFYRRFHPARG